MELRRITFLLTTAVSLLFAVVSCNKDEGLTPNPAEVVTPNSGEAEQVEICITGDFNDFGTKAQIENVFRMTWAEGTGDPKVYDKVYVYGQASGSNAFSCLGSLDAVPDASTSNRVADLKGTITAPKTGTKMTLVYSPLLASAPSVNNGAIKIDLSSQSGKAGNVTFVAYTAVDYDGNASANYRTSFSFATSVLRVNVTGLAASAELTQATIRGIENICKLTLATNAAPAVDGYYSYPDWSIDRTFTSCSSNAKGTAAFYVAVPAITANGGRSLTVTQSGNEYDAFGFAAGQKSAGNMMNSIAELITTGQRGVLNGQEYVLIKAQYDGKNYSYLKWATQNLTVTTSGCEKWSNTKYVIGDYFQWGASYDGYGITDDAKKTPENLLIYKSYAKEEAGYRFSVKDGISGFNDNTEPYSGSSGYTKYTSSDSKTALELTDDVANIVLGGTWHIPTGGSDGQFSKMRAATYWAWDETEKGYYVFKPGMGTNGAANEKGTINETDDKTKALLFFPAVGYGTNVLITLMGKQGVYCTRTRDSSDPSKVYVYQLDRVMSPTVETYYRSFGLSVRPVSE